MAFEKTNRRLRDDGTIDTTLDLSIHGPSKIMHRTIDMNAAKPYFIHDVDANITYCFGKTKITQNELSEVIKKELENPDRSYKFQDAICIEFCKESFNDILPKARAILAQAKIRAEIEKYDLPIVFSTGINVSSKNGENQNQYSEYLVLKADEKRDYHKIKVSIK